jgi:hypothetical protein
LATTSSGPHPVHTHAGQRALHAERVQRTVQKIAVVGRHPGPLIQGIEPVQTGQTIGQPGHRLGDHGRDPGGWGQQQGRIGHGVEGCVALSW